MHTYKYIIRLNTIARHHISHYNNKHIISILLGKDKFSFEAAGLDLEFNTAKGELTIIQGGSPIVFTRDGGPVVVAAPAVAPAAPAKGKKK